MRLQPYFLARAEVNNNWAAAAKAAAGDAQRLLGKEGIQIHGGIGFTWEHDAQLFFKRLKAEEQAYGDAVANRERVAAFLESRA